MYANSFLSPRYVNVKAQHEFMDLSFCIAAAWHPDVDLSYGDLGFSNGSSIAASKAAGSSAGRVGALGMGMGMGMGMGRGSRFRGPVPMTYM